MSSCSRVLQLVVMVVAIVNFPVAQAALQMCLGDTCQLGCTSVSITPGACVALPSGRFAKITCDSQQNQLAFMTYSDSACRTAPLTSANGTSGACSRFSGGSFRTTCAQCNRDDPFYAMNVFALGTMTSGYASAPAGSRFDAINGSVASISVWVNMSASQPSETPHILSIIPNQYLRGDANNTLFVMWNNKLSRLEVRLTTSRGTTNAVVGGTGLVRVPVGHWRLITVVVDSARGLLKLYSNTILEFVTSFPELITEGFTQVGSTSPAIRLGCRDQGLLCMRGYVGDVIVQPRDPSMFTLHNMFMFRTWLDGSCDVGDPYYPANSSVFRFGPAKSFSMPGGIVTFGSDTVIAGNGLRPRIVADVPARNASWTTTQLTSINCGATQRASLTMPNTINDWVVALMIMRKPGAPNPQPQLRVTTASGLLLTTAALPAPTSPGMLQRVAFFYSGSRLDLVASITNINFVDWCIATIVVEEKGASSINTGEYTLPGVVYENTPTVVMVYAGIPAAAKVAFSTRPMALSTPINCSAIAPSAMISLNPVMHNGFDGSYVNFYTFMAPPLSKGVYGMCLFPSGSIDGQTMLARGTNSHISALLVVELPGVASPLPTGWINSLLHLGSNFFSFIPHGLMNVDYFSSIGGEASMQPVDGDYLQSNVGNLTWTPTTVADGVWGTVLNDTTDNNWIQYFSLALYAPSAQSVVFTVANCESLDMWVSGAAVYQSRECRAALSQTLPFNLAMGWSQVVIKLHRATKKSYFSLRVDQSYGLSWNFYIPRGPNGQPVVANYTDICSKTSSFSGSVPCVGDNIVVSETDCYAMGCCYDSTAATNDTRCYAPQTGRQTWRADGRCGFQFPAAAINVSECNLYSSTHAVCCSPHGWCGNSSDHCNCPTCANYEYFTLGRPRCTYALWGRGAGCTNVPQVTLPQLLEGDDCRQKCDFTPGCTGYSRGKTAWSFAPATCTLLFGDCPKTFVDDTISETYRAFCNGCGFVDTCTSCACSLNYFNVQYGGPVSRAECQEQCSINIQCSGIEYKSDGMCLFSQRRCSSTLTNTSNGADYIGEYRCLGDNTSMPTPLPQVFPGNFGTDDYNFIGCFGDARGFLLSEPAYNKNMMTSPTSMSVSQCFQYCDAKGTRFFSLYNGTRCSCGVRYQTGLLPLNPNTACAVKCPGNASQTCGGAAASMLYQIPLRQGVCPSNYTYFNNWCYKYVGADGTGWLNWTAAWRECRRDGGVLTSVLSDAENQYLVSLPFIGNESNTRIIWVGCHDVGVGDGFVWADGWAVNFTDWRAGEPNAGGWTTHEEECVEIFSNYPTPFKGTWNDRSCDLPLPYVCKRSTNASATIGAPQISAALAEGSTACVGTTPSGQLDTTLIGWWPLNQVVPNTPSSSMPVLADSSVQGHNLYFTYNESEFPAGSKPTPRFTPGVINNALIFGGQTYLDSHQGFAAASGTISVAVWLKPDTATATSIIVSQSLDLMVGATGDFGTQFAWALTQENGKYCWRIGGVGVCSAGPLANPNQWQHVAASFDGVRLAIYVNAAVVAQRDLDNVVAIPSSVMSVTIGYRSALPYERYYIYRGMMDDARLYDAAITPSDVFFLSSCTPDGSPLNVLYLYQGSAPTVTLYGHSLSVNQRLGLSASGQCDGTPITGHYLRVLPVLDGSGTARIKFITQTTQTAGMYAVCAVSPIDPELFNIPTGLMIGVAVVNAVNNSATLVVNSTQFPITLALQGMSLAATQQIAIAIHPTCNHLSALNHVTLGSPSDGSVGYITIRAPTALTDVLYLCWASSVTAVIGSASGGYTSQNAYNTGVQVVIQTGNIRMKRLATVDGTKTMDRNAFVNGVYYSDRNYVLPCADGLDFGDSFALVVSMGLYTDYLIPKANFSLCDVLVGPKVYLPNGIYSYSARSPLSNLFDGTMEQVPVGSSFFFGGSPQYWPADGREYLSVWGSPYSSRIGGCCQNQQDEIPGWYRSYTLVAVELPANAVYLSLVIKPTAVFNFTPLLLHANVVDIHGTVLPRPVSFTVTFTGLAGLSPGLASQTFTSPNGNLLQYLQPGINVGYGTGFTMTLTINGVNITNGNSQSWAVNVVPPPTSIATGITPNSFITTFLHFGNATQVIPSGWSQTTVDIDWFPDYGGEANIKPNVGDPMTVYLATQSLTYTWQEVSNPTGQWSFNNAAVTTYAIQFFAGALFAPDEQNVKIRYSCDDGMMLYIDGKQIIKSDTIAYNKTTRSILLEPGWHQVVIKFLQRSGGSLLALQFLGNSLMWRTELPADVPAGATPLGIQNSLRELLHLGGDLTTGFSGAFETDFLNTEQLAAPRINEVVSGLTWTHITTGSSTWSLPPVAPTNGTVPSVSQTTVHYFALGVYAAARGFAVFDVSYSGPCRILWDGQILLDDGDNAAATSTLISINTTVGWHQLLVKLGVTQLSGTDFSMTLIATNCDLSWAMQVPVLLPSPAEVLQGDLSFMMALVNGNSNIAIPFDPRSPAASVTSLDFNLTATPPFAPYSEVMVNTLGDTFPFYWIPMQSLTGQWGQRMIGGNFNMYWTLALYASEDMPVLPGIAEANLAYAMWVDGKLASSAATYTPGGSRFSVSLTKGWHTVLLKLKAPDDLVVIDVPSTTSYADANALCHQRRLQLCSRSAVCPYSTPRPGVFPAPFNSSFVPVRDNDNTWVQVGTGGNRTSTCSLISAPTWGTQEAPIAERRQVACCGAYLAPVFEMQLFPDTSKGEQLGWAFSAPLPPLTPPRISVDNRRKTRQLVTISTIEANAQIIYTIDGTTPTYYNGRLYRGPFNRTTSTTIMAIVATSENHVSAVATYVLTIPRYVEADRTTAVAGAFAVIGFNGVIPDFAVVFAPSRNTTVLQRLAASLQFAMSVPTSPTFSGVVTFDGSLDARVPPLMPGNYTPIFYPSILPADPTAATTAIKGYILDYSPIEMTSVAVMPSATFNHANVQIKLAGGVLSGDTVQFLDLLMGSDVASRGLCNYDGCAAAFSSSVVPPLFALQDPTMPLDLGAYVVVDLRNFTGTLSCLCYASTGRAQSAVSAVSLAAAFPISISVVAVPPPGTPTPSGMTTLAPAPSGSVTPRPSGSPAPTGPLTPVPSGATPTPGTAIAITGVTPRSINTGSTLTITGRFVGATQRTTTIDFVAATATANPSVPAPRCAITYIDPATIQCTLTAVAGTSGQWIVSVYAQSDVGVLGLGMPIVAIPPPPVVLGAYGECVRMSKYCVSGAVVHFTGTNFDSITWTNTAVQLYSQGVLSTTVLCRVTAVTDYEVQCQLIVPDGTTGSYDVRVAVTVANGTVNVGDSRANLIFGQGNEPGWSGSAAVAPTTNSPATPSTGGMPTWSIAVIACLGAAVAVGLIVAVYTRKRFRLVERDAAPGNEMDYIEQQLLADGTGARQGDRSGAAGGAAGGGGGAANGSAPPPRPGQEGTGIHVEVPMPSEVARLGGINDEGSLSPSPAPPRHHDMSSNM